MEENNQLGKIDVEKLRRYAYEMRDKYVPDVHIVFDKMHKKKYGATKFDEGQSIIHLYFGQNLEKIMDDIDEGIYLDTVLHEIAHVLTHNTCEYHSHDSLWKANAQKIGARPVSSESRLSYEVYVKLKMEGTILGQPIKVFKNLFPEDEYPDYKYRSLGIEKNLDTIHDEVRPSIGNILLVCPSCKREWIRKREGNFICPDCKVYVDCESLVDL